MSDKTVLRKCKSCNGTGYTAKEMNNPIFAGVCRECQGLGKLGGRRKAAHVPQYQGFPMRKRQP